VTLRQNDQMTDDKMARVIKVTRNQDAQCVRVTRVTKVMRCQRDQGEVT
jgi:hypothetical protein